jgi:hypothetical protein
MTGSPRDPPAKRSPQENVFHAFSGDEARLRKQLPSVDDMRWQTKEQKKEVKTMSEVLAINQMDFNEMQLYHSASIRGSTRGGFEDGGFDPLMKDNYGRALAKSASGAAHQQKKPKLPKKRGLLVLTDELKELQKKQLASTSYLEALEKGELSWPVDLDPLQEIATFLTERVGSAAEVTAYFDPHRQHSISQAVFTDAFRQRRWRGTDANDLFHAFSMGAKTLSTRESPHWRDLLEKIDRIYHRHAAASAAAAAAEEDREERKPATAPATGIRRHLIAKSAPTAEDARTGTGGDECDSSDVPDPSSPGSPKATFADLPSGPTGSDLGDKSDKGSRKLHKQASRVGGLLHSTKLGGPPQGRVGMSTNVGRTVTGRVLYGPGRSFSGLPLTQIEIEREPWRPQNGPEFTGEFRQCYVRLTVFPCDDKDHPGTEIYVRRDHERAYEDLLDVLNKRVPPTTGPAVCLYDQVLSCCTHMDELRDDEFYVVSAGAIPQWESMPRRFRKRMPLFLAAVDQRHVQTPSVPPTPEKFRPVDWISHVSPKSTAAQLMHLQTEKRLNEARIGRALVNSRRVGRSLPRKHLKGDTIDASTMLTPGLSNARVTQRTPCPEERPEVRAYRESLRALELHRSG